MRNEVKLHLGIQAVTGKKIQQKEPARVLLLIVVALFLAKESITDAATVYFPDLAFPFTRACEPRNRSPYMSPPGKTSLLVEIPCQPEDEFWRLPEENLIQLVRSPLIEIGWIKPEEIMGTATARVDYAYPILEMGFEDKVEEINNFLDDFSNLRRSGRNGKFVYAWIHDMMRFGKEIVEQYGAAKE